MDRIGKIVLVSALALACSARAIPQQAASGPSLVDTMKYIEDKLNSIAPVNYTAYPPDGGDSFPLVGGQYRHHYTADAAACSLTSETQGPDGKTTDVVPLRSVSKIEAGTLSTLDTLGWRYVPDPPVVRLTSGALNIERTITQPNPDVRRDKHQTVAPMVSQKLMIKVWAVTFDDADAADRTAKALLHAVELCGGGSRKELF